MSPISFFKIFKKRKRSLAAFTTCAIRVFSWVLSFFWVVVRGGAGVGGLIEFFLGALNSTPADSLRPPASSPFAAVSASAAAAAAANGFFTALILPCLFFLPGFLGLTRSLNRVGADSKASLSGFALGSHFALPSFTGFCW